MRIHAKTGRCVFRRRLDDQHYLDAPYRHLPPSFSLQPVIHTLCCISAALILFLFNARPCSQYSDDRQLSESRKTLAGSPKQFPPAASLLHPPPVLSPPPPHHQHHHLKLAPLRQDSCHTSSPGIPEETCPSTATSRTKGAVSWCTFVILKETLTCVLHSACCCCCHDADSHVQFRVIVNANIVHRRSRRSWGRHCSPRIRMRPKR